jgi:hypothetical protein
MVFVNSPKMAEEMRKATDSELSFTHAVSEVSPCLCFFWEVLIASFFFIKTLQINYTLGKDFDLHRSQVVRGAVTKNIADRFSDIRDEIVESLNDEIPVTEGKIFCKSLRE